MMSRGIAAAAAVFAIALPGVAQAGPPGQASTPGAPGVGDPYFPEEGNGGYDVRNYDLSLGYDPATDHLDGLALIKARATQTLGSDTVRLIGAQRFTTQLQSGQKAEARGLLNRVTGETRIDVLSLQTVGACAS